MYGRWWHCNDSGRRGRRGKGKKWSLRKTNRQNHKGEKVF
jgi:hypothetical protein